VRLLEGLGYTRVSHFAGGLEEWQEASLPLESVRAPAPVAPVRIRRAPHDWGMVLVDLFERRSAAELVALWLGTIVVCAVCYWLLGGSATQGLRSGGARVPFSASGFLSALYFSFVTATSVGFGDIVPLGGARAIAIVEAVAGLLVFGAVVSKLVSRRQEHIVAEIHRITFEDRLERVQTDLHLVLSELQAIATLCQTPDAPHGQVRSRVDSASGICLGELRAIHDLLYRPQTTPAEEMLEGILASLALVMREMRDLLRCLADRSPYLTRNIGGLSRLADEICADCVPRRYAPALREWMDQIQSAARDLK
jgi:hypothetical protein